MQWTEIVTTVVGGLAVAFLSWLVSRAWARRRVPVGINRHVTRSGYLRGVLRASLDERVDSLDLMWPNLKPARGDERLTRLQQAWADINSRGGTRVLIHNNGESLTAGAELLALGIEVRVAEPGKPEDVSYHHFAPADQFGVVINYRDRRGDRPSWLPGQTPAKVFRTHFDTEWEDAKTLESVLADEVLRGLRPSEGRGAIRARMRELAVRYRLGDKAERAVLTHIAFRHDAPVVFITGLPGAGKSRVRALLAERLSGLRFQVDEQSDYLYAFFDLLHKVMLMGGRGAGFTPHPGGAFQVDDERSLEPALEELVRRVCEHRGGSAVVLVEFARSDLAAALAKFGADVLANAHVVHVTADPMTRADRLSKRAEPPQLRISGREIVLRPSDNHSLPSAAASTLYSVDGLATLRKLPGLKGRVHEIDNDFDDPRGEQLNARIEGFIDHVVRPYRVA